MADIDYRKYLKVWLRFHDESNPLKDECGNGWTPTGSMVISENNAKFGKALQLDGSNQLSLNGSIILGGQDFSIDFYGYMSSNSGAYAPFFSIHPTTDTGGTTGTNYCVQRSLTDKSFLYGRFGGSGAANETRSTGNDLNAIHHLAYVYKHDTKQGFFFVDGKKFSTSGSITTVRTAIPYFEIAGSAIGAIEEFRVYDGIARWTTDFTPPTADDYVPFDQKTVLSDTFLLTRRPELEAITLQFSGKSSCYAQLPQKVLTNASVYTLEIKFSTTSTVANNQYMWNETPLICKRRTGSKTGDIGIVVKGGYLCFWDDSPTKSAAGFSTNYYVSDGAVHKVSLVSAADGSLRLYLDGQLISTQSDRYATISGYDSLYIARDGPESSHLLAFDMYEARFWSVARSEEEIFADIKGSESGLEAWYLPIANGSTLFDQSSRGNNATLYGNPTLSNIAKLRVYTDTLRVVKNHAYEKKLAECTKVLLHFDDPEDPYKDECGNEWTATGSPTISETNAKFNKALQLSSGSYIRLANPVVFGGKDFTIDFWAYANSSQVSWAGFLSFKSDNPNDGNGNNSLYFGRNSANSTLSFALWNTSGSSIANTSFTSSFLGLKQHYAIVYQHAILRWLIFVNGKLVFSTTLSQGLIEIARYVFIGRAVYNQSQYFSGAIDEFRIVDGLAVWTEDFTPPTEPYSLKTDINVGLLADTARSLSNIVTVDHSTLRDVDSIEIIASSTKREVIKSVERNSDTIRDVQRYLETISDTDRNIERPDLKIVDARMDTLRDIRNIILTNSSTVRDIQRLFSINADTTRNIENLFSVDVDSERKVTRSIEVISSTDRNVNRSVENEADTERVVKQIWRYENYGTADLALYGTTVKVDRDKSIWKSAFYQGKQEKCFDIPSTKEIWIKVDLYHVAGESRFRIYNSMDNTNGLCLKQYRTITIETWRNGSSVDTQDILTPDTLQTFLLHMLSDSISGVLEYWLNGTKMYSFSGNVNNGNAFDDIFIQTERDDNLFSNLIISNDEIGLNENATFPMLEIYQDTVRLLSGPFNCQYDMSLSVVRSVELNLDIYSELIKSQNIDYDTFRNVFRSVEFNADTARAMPLWIINVAKSHKVPGLTYNVASVTDTDRYLINYVSSFQDTNLKFSKSVSLEFDTLRNTDIVWRYENPGDYTLFPNIDSEYAANYFDNYNWAPYTGKSYNMLEEALYQTDGLELKTLPAIILPKNTKEVWIKFTLCLLLFSYDFSVKYPIVFFKPEYGGFVYQNLLTFDMEEIWDSEIFKNLFGVIWNTKNNDETSQKNFNFCIHLKLGTTDEEHYLEIYVDKDKIVDTRENAAGTYLDIDPVIPALLSPVISYYDESFKENPPVVISDVVFSNVEIGTDEHVSLDSIDFSRQLIAVDSVDKVATQGSYIVFNSDGEAEGVYVNGQKIDSGFDNFYLEVWIETDLETGDIMGPLSNDINKIKRVPNGLYLLWWDYYYGDEEKAYWSTFGQYDGWVNIDIVMKGNTDPPSWAEEELGDSDEYR